MRWPWQQKSQVTSTVSDNRGGWWPWVREPYAGAWQRNIEWSVDTVLAHHAVYACITLIASDVGKLRPKLVQQDTDGIWEETSSGAFSPVLRKPNRYQNHIQFKEWWITSKLVRGNAYALKQRDNRGIVTALYLLDPSRVTVLVAPDGAVYYQLGDDNLSGTKQVTVPASEIIHDRMNCLFHPLVGISPIFASGMAASIGLKIEGNAAAFFMNGSNPSGIITGPENIPESTALRIKEYWSTEYSGDNSGRIAVLGNGLKFVGMRMTAVDSQMIEHLKWTAETVCATFHVPAFKVGIGAQPAYANPEILDRRYYSDCLQYHIESMELALDEGLGVGVGVTTEGRTLGVELDLDGLLRMDTASQVTTLVAGIRGGLYTPNGARRKIDEKPLEGGDTIYLQHQDYPMEMVFNRDDLNPKPAPPAKLAESPPIPIAPADEGKAFDFDEALLCLELELIEL